MAVSKVEAINQVSPEVKKAVSAAELIIDKKFSNYSGERVIVDIKELNLIGEPDFKALVLKKIMALYVANGWAVRLEYSQLDGDWLEFK